MHADVDSPPHAQIPADVSTPDKILYGLTARQALIVAVAGLACYGLWHAVGHRLPPVAVIAALIPIVAVAVVLAVGRRDGLSTDRWLLAALGHHRTPRHLVPAPGAPIPAAPAWAPQPSGAPPGVVPSVLRLPAESVTLDGVIHLGGPTTAVMIAATTVNIGLRTTDEQWALLGGYGRWLNALTGPVQIVISRQRADLSAHAARIVATAATLNSPALAAAAGDYADFLLDVTARRDPLTRTVTVVATASGHGGAVEATRIGRQSAAALAGLGVETRVLDGGAVTAVLAAATDPYQYRDASHRRTPAQQPITVAEGLHR